MWYQRVGKQVRAQGIGGGVIPKSLATQGQTEEVDPTSKSFWNVLVDSPDHIGSFKGSPNVTDGDGINDSPINEGPATQADEMRRLSPHHTDPEETTWEERLQSVRHQNVNNPNSPDAYTNMQQAEAGQGEMAVKGMPQYNQGKSAEIFDNDNKSSIQSFAR